MAFSGLNLHDLLIPFLVLLLPVYYYLVFFRSSKTNESRLPTNWPLVGMLPSLFVVNLGRFHDYMATVLAAAGGSFEIRGPPGVRFLITCDPSNVRHIFVSSFGNYPKGEEFASFFDVMGDSFFNADGESWRRQRARVQHIMSGARLLGFMARCCRDKVEAGLLPLLAHMADGDGKGNAFFNLQDVFTRFSFDMTAKPVFGVDAGRLSVDMPPMHVPEAMDAVMEVGFFRHTVPVACWKLMRLLGIGPERKLAEAQPVLRRFVAEMLERRKQQTPDVDVEDIASHYVDDPEYVDERGEPREFLCATLINYMFAGRDTVGATLSWLVYNLVMHPRVAHAVRRELAPIVAARKDTTDDGNGMMVVFEPEETKPLVYLHAALFESMRLYPPGPIERKEVLASDVLPSGHAVRAGDKILVSLYGLGRMESAWGKDCAEYRPERWITEDGGHAVRAGDKILVSLYGLGRMESAWGKDCAEYRPERWITEDGGALRRVPAHRFLPFNAGPRSCLGKDISVAQMKCVAAAVVWNFDFELLEGHAVEPKLLVVLQMKNGLMVKAKKRHAGGSE